MSIKFPVLDEPLEKGKAPDKAPLKINILEYYGEMARVSRKIDSLELEIKSLKRTLNWYFVFWCAIPLAFKFVEIMLY